MSDLIARLEAAEEPSRELDTEIWLACVPGTTRNQWSYTHVATGRLCDINETRELQPDGCRRLVIVPNYTASIDAALTLVPDGMWWLIGAGRIRQKEPLYGAQILCHDPDPPYTSDVIAEGEHDAGPAVALCIAALKARLV